MPCLFEADLLFLYDRNPLNAFLIVNFFLQDLTPFFIFERI